jgi:hypothetical protein
MSNNFPPNPPNYVPLFEIGLMNGKNPAIKGFTGFCSSTCPITLAAIMTALFEAVMMNIEENKQIEYEKLFSKAFKKLMKDRHTLEITRKLLEFNEDKDEDNEREF